MFFRFSIFVFLFFHDLKTGKKENIRFFKIITISLKSIKNDSKVHFDTFQWNSDYFMKIERFPVFQFWNSGKTGKEENKTEKQENILFYLKVNQEIICSSYKCIWTDLRRFSSFVFSFFHTVGLNRGKTEKHWFSLKNDSKVHFDTFQWNCDDFKKSNVFLLSSFQIVEKQENKNGKLEKHLILLENTSRTNLQYLLVYLKWFTYVFQYCFLVFPYSRAKLWKNRKTEKHWFSFKNDSKVHFDTFQWNSDDF